MTKTRIAMLLAVLLLLCGCRGKPLPAGMEETALTEAGRAVVLQLVQDEYEAVRESFREDVRESVTADQLRTLLLQQTDGAGVYRQIESTMVTGQSSDGEHYGVAVLYCEYSEDDVLFRVAFDKNLKLIGLEIRKQ